jgi:hypothetical protein
MAVKALLAGAETMAATAVNGEYLKLKEQPCSHVKAS